MIILNNFAFDPIYTRITVYRMYIYAEIAVNANKLPGGVTPGSEIIVEKFGILYIDSTIIQGTTMIIRAYDPLAFLAKHKVCDNISSTGTWMRKELVTALVYDLIEAQTQSAEVRQEHHIELREAEHASTKEAQITIRYDMLYDIYTSLPEQFDPQLRLRITPYGLEDRTVYQPESRSATVAISADYAVDYAFFQIKPTQAFVALNNGSTPRSIIKIPDETQITPRQIFVNTRLGENATYAGRAAIEAGEAQAESTTIRVLASDLPEGIYPGDELINMPSDVLPASSTARMINAIEYATSSRGSLAYVMCGGKIMDVADRINAIIAADYAARY